MQTLNLLDSDFCLRLTITLVHFLWLGTVIALALGVIGLCLRRASANSRYVAGVAALVIMVACLPVTFALVQAPPSEPVVEVAGLARPLIVESTEIPAELPLTDTLRVADLAPTETEPAAGVAAESGITEPPADAIIERKSKPEAESTTDLVLLPLRSIATYATSVYLLGVAAMLLRLVVAVWGGQRLRLVSTPVTEEDLLAMIRRAARRVGAKAAPAVAYCQRVSVPVVVGIVKPVILLPASLASGMLPNQLETVLTHELAHIRRYDPLVNLLQRIVEAAFFFHPAVWYISRRVDIERENCCDDLVLSAGWKPVEYAEALVRLGELCCVENGLGKLNGAAVVAASGGSPSRFKRRVLRVLGVDDQPRLRLTAGGIAIVALLLVSLFAAPWIMRSLADNAEPASSPPEAGREVRELVEVALERKPGTEAQKTIETTEAAAAEEAKRATRGEENRGTAKKPDSVGVEKEAPAAVPLETSPHQEPVEIDVEVQRKTSDLARLQGVWKIVAEEQPDKKREGRDDLGWILFSGDRFLLQSASGGRLEAKYMLLHPPTRLKKINLITESGNPTHELRGIYSFDDDTLKLCLPSESGLDRPTAFAAGGESSATLVTLRRVNAGLLFVNRGRVIEPNIGSRLKSVLVRDPSVLEVIPLDAKRIQITTKKVGGTVLTIVDENDRKTQMDIIVVKPNDLNLDTPALVIRERDVSGVAPAEWEEPSSEEPSDWHRGPEGLQYRVRPEKAAWRVGEVPLLYVDIRNRGRRDDVAIETHQTQQRLHVRDVVYERKGQPWGGLERLEPGGEHLTIPFTLCDWTAVSNPHQPLKLPAGKQDLRAVIHIAVMPQMSVGVDGVPVYTVPIPTVQPFELLTAPFQIEILPSDHKTPLLDTVRENIRRELVAFPRFHTPKVPPTLHHLVRDHLPHSGDHLLKVLESGDDSLHWPAGVTFADSWDQMTHVQIKRYLQLSLKHTIDQREQYPHGIDAGIRMGVGYDLDYRCVPSDRKYESHSVTTHFLDGKQYGEPFSYPKYSACTGWIETKDLEVGKHSIRLITDYEFTRGESTWKGQIESSDYEFEIVPADVPDHLATPRDADVERIVRESFKIAETSDGLKSEAQILRERFRLPVGLPSDPWKPQIRWTKKKDGQFTGLHLPVWKVTRPLPVDLCFRVEVQIQDTDVVLAAGDLVVLKGEHRESYIGIHRSPSIDTLLKHRDESGFVPVSVVLKPSRAAALTYPTVTCYFNHEITSRDLRIKLTGGSDKNTEARVGHGE